MKNNKIYSSFAAISCLAAFYLPLNPVSASAIPSGVQYAYDGQDLGAMPGYIQLNGYYTPQTFVSTSNTDGLGIHNGTQLSWDHSGKKEYVHYVYGNAFFQNESTPGTVLDYALDNKTTNNGYFLVAKKNLIDWVNYLGGNATYVDVNLQNLNAYSVVETSMGDMWDVADLVKAIDSCGATVDYAGGGAGDNYKVNSDGTTAQPAIKVTPTPSPQSQISVAQSNYAIGSKIPINLTAKVYAANTNWHMEAVEVTGPNGFDKFLPVDTGVNGMGAAATGTAFPYWGPVNGTLGEIYGGGSGDPSTPATMNETATLDTTGLVAGTYTVTYTLFDAVGRASTSGTGGAIQITFTLGSSGGSGGGNGGSSGGGSADPNMNLSVKFDPFSQPIKIGMADIPITVSNDGNQDETTTLKFMRNGFKSTPVYVPPTYDSNGNLVSNGYTYYKLTQDTVTQTQTITVPVHDAKQVTMSVFTGERILGDTKPGDHLYDDPNYVFQVVASINDDRSIAETTYADDTTNLWVTTQGVTVTPPGVHLTE